MTCYDNIDFNIESNSFTFTKKDKKKTFGLVQFLVFGQTSFNVKDFPDEIWILK